jgi:hypothetical protein
MKRFKIIIVAFLIGAFFGTAGFCATKTEFCPKQTRIWTINLMLKLTIEFQIQNSNKAAATLILKQHYKQKKQSSEAKFAFESVKTENQT